MQRDNEPDFTGPEFEEGAVITRRKRCSCDRHFLAAIGHDPIRTVEKDAGDGRRWWVRHGVLLCVPEEEVYETAEEERALELMAMARMELMPEPEELPA